MTTSSPFTTRRKKSVKKIQFSIMVCGASGTGRTSFVNTLCGQKVLESSDINYEAHNAHLERGIDIRPASTEIDDPDGTRIALTIIDTPGFGDNIDNSQCFERIVGYLECQYDEVLAEESRIRRNPRFKDNRVHVCLYFIEPTGHGLRELDIEMMKQLSNRVNVIPVIGRADSLTPLEKAITKRMVMEDLKRYNIPIFNFPFDPEEDDPETIEDNSELREMLPFAIVSGTEVIHTGSNKTVYGRSYPWGFIDVEDPEHSDFGALRSALFGSHLMDLKDLTHEYLYENYRTEKLSGSTSIEDIRSSRLLNAEDLANQSYLLKGEQLAREGEKAQEFKLRVQREMEKKRLELNARENALREIEARISRERSVSTTGNNNNSSVPGTPHDRNDTNTSTADDTPTNSPGQETPTRVTSHTTTNTSNTTNTTGIEGGSGPGSASSFVATNGDGLAIKQEAP